MFFNQNNTIIRIISKKISITKNDLIDFFSFLKFAMIYPKKPKFYFLYYFNHQYQILIFNLID